VKYDGIEFILRNNISQTIAGIASL